jgi:hypothetical protein
MVTRKLMSPKFLERRLDPVMSDSDNGHDERICVLTQKENL